MKLLDLYNAIVDGNLQKAIEVTEYLLKQGIQPQNVINNALIKGMEEIGMRFHNKKAFVPNLLLSARAMKGSLEVIKPLLNEDNNIFLGKIVIGTVKGDLHDIGKNLVASMLEGCGFEVIDLGVDISSETFVDAAMKHNADIVCLSALLTTTMNYMRGVIQSFNESSIRKSIKIMVGGAPVSMAFAHEIGADGYSHDASEAVTVAKKMMEDLNT